MKRRKKRSKVSQKALPNVYKVQYQLIHVARTPIKDPHNPKAAPQETRRTSEHFRHVLAADKTAAAAYVQSFGDKDHEIHLGLITEIVTDVVGNSSSKGRKHSNKRRKAHGKTKVRKTKISKTSA